MTAKPEEGSPGGAVDPAEVAQGDRAAGGGRAADEASDPAARAPCCDLCGAPMIERHCKIVCRNCGYQRDCSDP